MTYCLHQVIHHESIDLEKRKVPDAKFRAGCPGFQKTWAEEFHAVVAGIVKQNTRGCRNDAANRFSVFGDARGETGEISGEQQLRVVWCGGYAGAFIAKRFDFAKLTREWTRRQSFAQCQQRLEK